MPGTKDPLESRRNFLRRAGKGAIAGGIVTLASDGAFSGKDEGMAEQLRNDEALIRNDRQRASHYRVAADAAESRAHATRVTVEKTGAAVTALGAGAALTNKGAKPADDPRFDKDIDRRRRNLLAVGAGISIAGVTGSAVLGAKLHGYAKNNAGHADAIEQVELPIDRASGVSAREIERKQQRAASWREAAKSKDNVALGITLGGSAALSGQAVVAMLLADRLAKIDQEERNKSR